MSDLSINEDAQSGEEFPGSKQSSDESPGASQPNESAFPDEDEDTITMLDVIEREDELEEEASAVLGNSDEKNCTYLKGYIPRQALYSCATCSDGEDNPAAICLACSLECHDNHEVYELYTKRNYRCDCGNSKFKPEFDCKLINKQHKKLPLNENNKYNHNFSGRYCTCDKKFPPDEGDSSAESQDEMWQCIVCEDWYHSKHLGAKELPTKFEELICGPCVDKLEFVHYYRHVPEKKTLADQHSDPQTSLALENSDSQAENKDPITANNECILENLKKECRQTDFPEEASTTTCSTTELSKGPIFWLDCGWRALLCRCEKCMDMYKVKDCEYLLDDKDTVQYYEAQGKAIARNSETSLERGMSALNQMNRVAVVEALHGYDELKAGLSDYLRKFAEMKKVVREEDILEFFEQLKSKKRPRLDFS